MRVARYLISLCFVWATFSITAGEIVSKGKKVNKKVDEQIEQTAKLIVKGINSRDHEVLLNLYDFHQIGKQAWIHAFGTVTEKEATSVAQGIRKTFAQNYIAQTFNALNTNGGVVEYRGLRTIEGKRVALIRYDLDDNGMNFQEVTIDPQSGKITDWFDYVLGSRYTETLGNVFAVMMPEQSNLIGKLLGKRKVDSDIVNKFKQFGLYKRQGDYAKAYSILEQLPEELNTHKTFIAIKTELAQYLSMEEYNKQLALLATHYSDDPTMALMLVDYYFDYDLNRVVTLLDGVQKRLGKDSLLEWLKSSVLMQLGKHKEALTAIDYSITEEPTVEKFYWMKVAIFNDQKDFKSVIATLDEMEEKLDLEFIPEGFEEDEEYADFVKSQEFAAWSNKLH